MIELGFRTCVKGKDCLAVSFWGFIEFTLHFCDCCIRNIQGIQVAQLASC